MALPRSKKNKKTPVKNAPKAPPRSKITEEDLEELSTTIKEHFGWENDLRSFQYEAIKAQLLRKDVIVHAGTGSGKTAIAAGPHAHKKSEGMVTIMVSPLIALQNEQVGTFWREFKLKAIAINSASGGCTGHLMKKMCNGEWQVIIVSPEMLLSKKFIRGVLRNPGMARRLLSVVIDEAHVVSHWGDGFRKAYGRLGILRALLPKNTPFVAMTATLTRKVRRDVLHKLQFGSDYLNINTGNDRPNVSIVVRAIQNTMNSYTDLEFLIPEGVTTKEQIPKAFVYADSVAVGTEIEDYLSQLHPREFGDIVRPYSAAFSTKYRRDLMADFKSGAVRILVCTDAAGMGCNIPDIDIVVQWKMPTSVSSFVQRAGRAARAPNRVGLAVLLVEKSAYEVDLSALLQEMADTDIKKTKGTVKAKGGKTVTTETKGKGRGGQGKAGNQEKEPRKETAKERAAAKAKYATEHGVRRGALGGKHDAPPAVIPVPLMLDAVDEGLYTLIQSTTCRRRVLGEIFGNSLPIPVDGVPCCDICDPSLLSRTRPGKPKNPPRTAAVKKGLPDWNGRERLNAWRMRVFNDDFAHLGSEMGPSAVLRDETIETLLSVGPYHSKEQLRNLIGGQWIWYDEYCDDLLKELQSMRLVFRPKPKKTNLKHAREPDEEGMMGEGDGASSSGHKRQRVLATVTDDTHNPTQPPCSLPSSASASQQPAQPPSQTQHYSAHAQPSLQLTWQPVMGTQSFESEGSSQHITHPHQPTHFAPQTPAPRRPFPPGAVHPVYPSASSQTSRPRQRGQHSQYTPSQQVTPTQQRSPFAVSRTQPGLLAYAHPQQNPFAVTGMTPPARSQSTTSPDTPPVNPYLALYGPSPIHSPSHVLFSQPTAPRDSQQAPNRASQSRSYQYHHPTSYEGGFTQ
ncbi:P-loop containing nucleoside triphosphate hydrolase protein [Pluteus cervinus]|uniref:P-loop containing nucleoside triphosphate hydrolase protein n=1 Tax=Pluteus cervinus TaxID=181527 RepID=A0ACD3AHI7_9AGAR|nr:P-loop containing nucleoside triphosphate hydrolase protein [Pluteus cervinus]